jgi:CBS domain-containing membrane protein
MLANNTVSFVMTAEPLITVDVSDPLSAVRRLFAEHSIHHVPVLQKNKLVGIISSTDLLRFGIPVEEGLPEANARRGFAVGDAEVDADFRIEEVMEPHLVTLHPKDSLLRAAQLLAQEHFNSLPVVDEQGELVGILTTRDLLRFLVEAEEAAPG